MKTQSKQVVPLTKGRRYVNRETNALNIYDREQRTVHLRSKR